ncbi:SIS domain-containing protein [Virgibacillus sp. C22-A2]|uniref:SIS domain-containing protein n=1 Tax=Virgibacillus tibetensis TaxID=3042313 RepID=A0ABU6KGU2_9BACI|nr:SIS domain-containing protein [Virgibacillus sp. C22-A2]
MLTLKTILGEMESVLNSVNKEHYTNLVEKFKEDRRFFFVGEGRSGLIAKTIAMRLMHSGKTVFVVGETTTPAIQEGDLLIIVSGSAATGNIVNLLKTTNEIGAEAFLVTTNPAKLESENGLLIKAATKSRKEGEPSTIQPLGNQFDQSVHLILDAAIIDSQLETDTNTTFKRLHSNLE